MRAGIVEKHEDYRWNSIKYHVQTNNADDFLSLDFGPVKCASLSPSELHRAGLKEFNVVDSKERFRPERGLFVKAIGGMRTEKIQIYILINRRLTQPLADSN